MEGQPTAFRPPTWVLALAPGAALGASNQVMSLVPAVCLVAAALLARHVVSRIADKRYAIIAALAVLLYPLNAYSATTLYPQILAMTLLLLVWVLLQRLDGLGNLCKVDAVLTGFLCSALALGVPTMIYTSAAVLAWMLFQHRRRVTFFLLAGTGFGTPILIWLIRNLAVMGSPILFSTTSGVNLLRGNNAHATGSSGTQVDISSYLLEADRLGLGEVARNDFFTQAALRWVRDDPAAAARLYLGKLLNYFSPYNEPATVGQGSSLSELVAWAAMLVVVALVVVRVVLARGGVLPMAKHEKFMLFLFVTNGPFMAVFMTRTRFRQPLDAILLVEAALGVTAVLMLLAQSRRRTRQQDSRVVEFTRLTDGHLHRGPARPRRGRSAEDEEAVDPGITGMNPPVR